jgi:hypothetical protein
MNLFEYTSPRDHALDPESEPPIGAHMVTPRRGYAHPAGCVEIRSRRFPCRSLPRGARSGSACTSRSASIGMKWSVGLACA